MMIALIRDSVKLPAIVLVCALSLGVFAGCGGSTSERGTVFYLAPGLMDEFQTESIRAIEASIGLLGYTVTTLDGQNRSDVQLNQLDSAILLDPAAIVIAAVDFDAVITGIEKARAAGIPVIAYDRQISSTVLDLTSIAGTVEIGRLAADEVARLLEERHGSVRGKVLQILGDPGDNYTLDIREGFDERMALHADVDVTTRAALQWEASNAGDIVEDHLLVDPAVDVIFSHAAHLSATVTAVLEAVGREPGDIMLISSNGAPIGLDNIRAGWQQVEVEQPLYAQAYGIAMFLDKLVRDEALEPGTYEVLGRQAELSEEPWGMTLRVAGEAVRPDNVNEPRFWGNLNPPSEPVAVVP